MAKSSSSFTNRLHTLLSLSVPLVTVSVAVRIAVLVALASAWDMMSPSSLASREGVSVAIEASVLGIASYDSGSSYWRDASFFHERQRPEDSLGAEASDIAPMPFHMNRLSPALIEAAEGLCSLATGLVDVWRGIVGYDTSTTGGAGGQRRHLGGLLAFIFLDGVVNTFLMCVVGCVLVPLYRYSPDAETSTPAKVHVAPYNSKGDDATDGHCWVCQHCGKPKCLAGEHLNGKREVRSDCYPCGRKRLFCFTVKTVPSPTGCGGNGASAIRRALRNVTFVGSNPSEEYNELQQPSEKSAPSSFRASLLPLVVVIGVLHVLNPFQVLTCLTMSLRVVEQTAVLLCIATLVGFLRCPFSLLIWAEGKLPRGASPQRLLLAGVVGVSASFYWVVFHAMVSVIASANVGAEALRISFVAPLLLWPHFYLYWRGVSTKRHVQTGIMLITVCTFGAFLWWSTVSALNRSSGSLWDASNGKEWPRPIGLPSSPPVARPTHHPPDAGVLWYLQLLVPSPVADLYPTLFGLFPSVLVVVVASVMVSTTTEQWSGEDENRVWNSATPVQQLFDSDTTPLERFMLVTHWWCLPQSGGYQHRQAKVHGEPADCKLLTRDEVALPRTSDTGHQMRIDRFRGSCHKHRRARMSRVVSLVGRSLWAIAFLFATLTRETFLRTDLSFAILAVALACPDVVYQSLLIPASAVDRGTAKQPTSATLPSPASHSVQLMFAVSVLMVLISVPVQHTMHISWLRTQLANPNWLLFVGLAHMAGFALGALLFTKCSLRLFKHYVRL